MNAIKNILVVEDSPPNRMILCHLLQKMGFEVFEACDGQEALEWLKQNPVDVIVTDLMMSKVDGLQLLKSVRADQRLSNIPVFVITALGEQEALKEAQDHNCNGILLKPISIFDLKASLLPLFPHLQPSRAG